MNNICSDDARGGKIMRAESQRRLAESEPIRKRPKLAREFEKRAWTRTAKKRRHNRRLSCAIRTRQFEYLLVFTLRRPFFSRARRKKKIVRSSRAARWRRVLNNNLHRQFGHVVVSVLFCSLRAAGHLFFFEILFGFILAAVCCRLSKRPWPWPDVGRGKNKPICHQTNDVWYNVMRKKSSSPLIFFFLFYDENFSRKNRWIWKNIMWIYDHRGGCLLYIYFFINWLDILLPIFFQKLFTKSRVIVTYVHFGKNMY